MCKFDSGLYFIVFTLINPSGTSGVSLQIESHPLLNIYLLDNALFSV